MRRHVRAAPERRVGWRPRSPRRRHRVEDSYTEPYSSVCTHDLANASAPHEVTHSTRGSGLEARDPLADVAEDRDQPQELESRWIGQQGSEQLLGSPLQGHEALLHVIRHEQPTKRVADL